MLFPTGPECLLSLAEVPLTETWGALTASVIPKSVNPGRLAQNLEAASIVLDDADMQAIAALDGPYRYIDGSFWALDGSPYTLQNLWDA